MDNLEVMQSFRRVSRREYDLGQKKTQKVSFRLTFWAKDACASKSERSIS
jgi:hypothetical protein